MLDESTLRIKYLRTEPGALPGKRSPQAQLLGLVTNRAEDLGKAPYSDSHFILEWETLTANRDQQRDEAPFASMLRLHLLPGLPGQLTGYTAVPHAGRSH
jgi:hypothetical protein